MKRRFIHLTGRQGQLRGWNRWKVGTHQYPDGSLFPFKITFGLWRTAKQIAIEQFPNATLFYVQKVRK